MRNNIPKIAAISAIVIAAVAWGASYIFFGNSIKSKADSELVAMSFNPSSVTKTSGDFTTVVKIKPTFTLNLRGYQFDVNFDKSRVKFKSITYKLGTVSLGLGDDSTKITTINTAGKIKVVGEIQATNGQALLKDSSTDTAEIVFTAVSVEPSTITMGDVGAKFMHINLSDLTLTEKLSTEVVAFSINGGAVPPVGAATATPGIVQPTSAFKNNSSYPPGVGGVQPDGASTTITEQKDLLYINSIGSYPAPFRYEQSLKLEKGVYSLLIGAKLFVKRGRGMILALMCNEASCGAKKLGEFMYSSLSFPLKNEYSEMSDKITIPDDADNKEFLLRIFCEDGSECDIDYISLEDAWGSQRIKNTHFTEFEKMSDPRKQPVSWQVDSTANLYGSVDPAFGKNGALMINNPAK